MRDGDRSNAAVEEPGDGLWQEPSNARDRCDPGDNGGDLAWLGSRVAHRATAWVLADGAASTRAPRAPAASSRQSNRTANRRAPVAATAPARMLAATACLGDIWALNASAAIKASAIAALRKRSGMAWEQRLDPLRALVRASRSVLPREVEVVPASVARVAVVSDEPEGRAGVVLRGLGPVREFVHGVPASLRSWDEVDR